MKKKRYAYVVEYEYNYEGGTIVGVYSNFKAARAAYRSTLYLGDSNSIKKYDLETGELLFEW